MKPRRRSTFSPLSAETALRSPRAKRRRFGSRSPRRKCSTSSDEVKPPPEFIPFPYGKLCPKLTELVAKNADEVTLDRDDMLCLQHELERMLAHSADYQRRAYGEVTYLNTGEYPVQDLKSRPMPCYKLRECLPVPSTMTHLQETLCGLPEDDTDDNVDIWPPNHIPQRFWTWCKADFLTPIDSEYLRNFKTLLLDAFNQEELSKCYVNEPWKHRKRQHCRSRICSSDLLGRTKRRSSIDAPCVDKRCKDKEEKSPVVNRKISYTSNFRPARCTHSRLAPLISDVVSAATREMRKDEFVTPNRRLSVRLHSLEDCENDRKLSIKSEPTDFASVDLDSGELQCAKHHTNGFSSRSLANCRLHSPRMKRESREEEEDWNRPGPSYTSCSNNLSSGRCNGESKTRPRRNGEAKSENTVSSSPNTTCHSSSIDSSATCMPLEDSEMDRHYREIGSRIVKMLVDRGLIPSSTEHVYREITADSVKREVVISQEGREEDDGSDLDEVSEELLRCQLELQDLEPRLRGVISHCWGKVQAEFAYWETSKQLDDADYDLFRLGVNMYRELPIRRVPTNAELPTLRAALRRRNHKARQHYGNMYRRLRRFRKKADSGSNSGHKNQYLRGNSAMCRGYGYMDGDLY